MRSKLIMFLLIGVLSITSLVSCASAPMKIQTHSYTDYVSQTETTQTQKGLTIEVVPLTERTLLQYPELYSWSLKDMPSSWRFKLSLFYPMPGEYSEEIVRKTYTFGVGGQSIVAMKVKVKNQTGHILRMNDARIYLRIENENPLKAVTKLGNPTIDPTTSLPISYINNDGSLVDWITKFENNWEKNREKRFLSLDYPVGTVSQVIAKNIKKYNLINDVDLEILPDDEYSGILVFPILASTDDIELKMYDITTDTDAAGNPTEKVTFSFKFKSNENKMWYDRNQKMWINGEPPLVTQSQ